MLVEGCFCPASVASVDITISICQAMRLREAGIDVAMLQRSASHANVFGTVVEAPSR